MHLICKSLLICIIKSHLFVQLGAPFVSILFHLCPHPALDALMTESSRFILFKKQGVTRFAFLLLSRELMLHLT